MNSAYIVIIAAILLGVFLLGSFSYSEFKEKQSKRRYMGLLINECISNLTNPKTRMTYHTHKFEWDYYTSTLKSNWDVWTDEFSVTAYGTSEQTRDVKNIDEFFAVSDIEYATIYLHNANITALHSYYDKADVERLVNAMKRLEANNNYKSESEKSRGR